MDHYLLRFYSKFLAFVTFSLLCLVGLAGSITYNFVYHNSNNFLYDAAPTFTIIGIYMGIFKYIVPSKADASGLISVGSTPSNSRPQTPQHEVNFAEIQHV